MSLDVLPLARLLQISDSAFPVGGYAFSHGLEWLSHERRLTEAELEGVLHTYVVQTGGSQWLPAACRAGTATTVDAALRVDRLLDASMSVAVEREAGRAMGERLLVTASDAFAGPWAGRYLEKVRSGAAPGQFAAVFGVVASEQVVPLKATLAALGMTMVASLVQAAVRLGAIGQSAAARLTAGAVPAVEVAVSSVLEGRRRRFFGASAPGLDVAGLCHPSLPFRMFAS